MLSTKINFPRKRFLILVLGPILGVVFNILPMHAVLDFSNNCSSGDICKGFPVVADNQVEVLINYLFWIGGSLVLFGFILLVNKLARLEISIGRLLLVIAAVSVTVGFLLALASNYIPRSSGFFVDCGYKCSGFPLISKAQNTPITRYSPMDCEYPINSDDYDPCDPYLDKNNFILTNFILNAAFYTVIVFSLVYITSSQRKKRTNANPRN